MDLAEYLDRIPGQHRQRPRYMAVVEALLRPLDDLAALLDGLRTDFDLDTAIGAQLDAVGVRVGRSRYIEVPLTDIYFSWNTEGQGWQQGLWKGPYDADSGLTRLPDDLYRMLLMAKVAANAWDGTIPHAYVVWETAFAGTSAIIFIQDHQDMSMTVGVSGSRLQVLFQELLVRGYVPLKPEGVRVTWVTVEATGPLFAWDIQSDALDGWGLGSWPLTIASSS